MISLFTSNTKILIYAMWTICNLKEKSKFFFLFVVCCPENTYGPNCKSCPGGTKSPCSGNGKCDVSYKELFLNQWEKICIMCCLHAEVSGFKDVLF